MKTVLVSILVVLLITSAPSPTKPKKEEVNIDSILSKCDKNLSKASMVTKVADQQQKTKITELHETVTKLEKEKQILKTVLTETKHELETVKNVIDINLTDTGEQFQLFPENQNYR
jgi:hypothetical protein